MWTCGGLRESMLRLQFDKSTGTIAAVMSGVPMWESNTYPGLTELCRTFLGKPVKASAKEAQLPKASKVKERIVSAPLQCRGMQMTFKEPYIITLRYITHLVLCRRVQVPVSRYASFLRLSFILAGTMRCAMQPGMCSSEIAALLSSQSKLQDVASMNYESSSFSRIFSTNDSMIAAMFLDFLVWFFNLNQPSRI